MNGRNFGIFFGFGLQSNVPKPDRAQIYEDPGT